MSVTRTPPVALVTAGALIALEVLQVLRFALH